MRPLRQPVYVILGTMFLLLGALGLFLPVLPTTPFWLLTCWFYLRGSNRLYARVMRNPYFGGYMRGFLEEKAIPLHGKIVTVVVMWGSALSSFRWSPLASPGMSSLSRPPKDDGDTNVCVGSYERMCRRSRTYV